MTDTTPPDRPGVVAPPPLILATSLGLALFAERVVALPLWPGAVTARWAFAALVAGGTVGIALWAVLRFRAARTNVEPWKPSTTLVTDGPYRWTRNPMYLGMAVLHLAVALAAASWWPVLTTAGFVWVMSWGVIAREERYLAAKFGPVASARTAPRWIGWQRG